MNSDTSFDVVVIGGGVAGTGVAAELASRARVLLIEGEEHLGMHSTGRSAALFSETYGDEAIRALTRASKRFFEKPPEGFADAPLTSPRGCLYIADNARREGLERLALRPDVSPVARLIGAEEALRLCPILKPESAGVALYEPAACDLDVDALQQAYIRRLRGRGGVVVMNAPVLHLSRNASSWSVQTQRGEYEAQVVVNASGAWADHVAELAGLGGLGIAPKRRTAVLVDPPADQDVANWPTVIDARETFYFKPQSGLLLLSPADETPSEACDAQPDELDVAIAVDRVETATTLTVRRVKQKWAGLRNFAPDRVPVAGFDPRTTGFFWLAGQGGYGIQTAPALSLLAASLVLNDELPTELADGGVTPAWFSPSRLISI